MDHLIIFIYSYLLFLISNIPSSILTIPSAIQLMIILDVYLSKICVSFNLSSYSDVYDDFNDLFNDLFDDFKQNINGDNDYEEYDVLIFEIFLRTFIGFCLIAIGPDDDYDFFFNYINSFGIGDYSIHYY